MSRAVRLLFGLLALVLLPSSVYAQAAIAGVVRDASGGVLPGVTVEASSPALIEKVRTAVSDGTGQYRIEDLRPGTCTVRFTLTGFSSVAREGTGPCNSCTFSAPGTLLSGGRANTEARLLVDGISIAVPQAGGTNYLTDPRNSQEVNFTVSGSLGEVESGGHPVMNIVSRAGGNKLSASGFVSWANGDLQGNSAYITNMYYNRNAGNPNAWLYEPDTSRQAFNDKT